MPRKGLCQNPDCGAFFDQPPVLFRDRYSKRKVWLCRACAAALDPSGQYERINETPRREE